MKKRNLNIFLVIVGIASLLVACFFAASKNDEYKEEGSTGDVTAEYYDISSYPNDSRYSYGTVFISENTQFIIEQKPGYQGYDWDANSNSWVENEYSYTEIPDDYITYKTIPGTSIQIPSFRWFNTGTLQMRITNSAIDADGKILDVIVIINNVHPWTDLLPYAGYQSHPDRFSIWFYPDNYYIFTDQDAPSHSNEENVNLSVGSPVMFWLNSNTADCDFTLKYVFHGTDEVDTNLDFIPGIWHDFDVPVGEFRADMESAGVGQVRQYILDGALFNGNEGVAFRGRTPSNQSTTKIYYNQDEAQHYVTDSDGYTVSRVTNATNGKYRAIMRPDPGTKGIYIYDNYDAWLGNDTDGWRIYRDIENGPNIRTDGIHYQTAMATLTSNANGVLEFEYGGIGCGIGYIFAGFRSFADTAPTKKVSSEGPFRLNEEYHYYVRQYIPNNYIPTKIRFDQAERILSTAANGQATPIYDTAAKIYKKLIITDTLDNHLTPQSGIKVYRDSVGGQDVTSLFTISSTQNSSGEYVVTATSNDGVFDQSFYSHDYILDIPVKATKYVTTSVTIGSTTSTGLPNNTAQSTIKYDGVADLVQDANNVDVKIKYKVVSRHYLANTSPNPILLHQPILTSRTNTKLCEDITIIDQANHNDSFTTNPCASIITSSANYRFREILVRGQDKTNVATVPELKAVWNADYTGGANSNGRYSNNVKEALTDENGVIYIDYYYEKKPAKVITNYLIDDSERDLVPGCTSQTERTAWGNSYSTTQCNPNGYTFSRMDPNGDPKTGTVNKNTVIVTYLYTRAKARVIVNHLPTQTINGVTPVYAQEAWDADFGTNFVTNYKQPGDLVSTYKDIYEWNQTTPSNDHGLVDDFVNSNNQIIVNYYYRPRQGTYVVHHYLLGTLNNNPPTSVCNDETFGMFNYGTSKTGNRCESAMTNYRLVSCDGSNNSPATSQSITINKPLTEITFCYVRKQAVVTTNHYLQKANGQKTTVPVHSPVTDYVNYDDEYTTNYLQSIDLDSNQNNELNYVFKNRYFYNNVHDGDAVTDRVTRDSYTVNYYYSPKPATITVHHLKEDSNTEICGNPGAPIQDTEAYYDKTYNYGICQSLNDSKYRFKQGSITINTNDNSYSINNGTSISGFVNQDNVEITFIYELKPASYTVHHMICDTNTKVHEDEVVSEIRYGQPYDTDHKNNDLYDDDNLGHFRNRYEWNGTIIGGDQNGVITTDNMTLTYCYSPKPVDIITEHIDKRDTSKHVHDNDIQHKHYGEEYTTHTYGTGDLYDDDSHGHYKNRYSYNGEHAGSPVSGTIQEIALNGEYHIIYYYDLDTAEYIVKHCDCSTTPATCDVAPTTHTLTNHYGTPYRSEYVESSALSGNYKNNWQYSSVSSNDTHATVNQSTGVTTGTFNQEKVEITYCYVQKKATVTAHYYVWDLVHNQPTEIPVHGDETQYNVPYGTVYHTTEFGTGDLIGDYKDNYIYYKMDENHDPRTGNVTKDNIDVIYYYKRNPIVLTTRHYIKGTNIEVSTSCRETNEELDRRTPYNKSKCTSLPNGYTFDNVRSDQTETVLNQGAGTASGTITKSTVLTFEYRLVGIGLTVEYYDIDTGQKIPGIQDRFVNKTYGDSVIERPINIDDYEYVSTTVVAQNNNNPDFNITQNTGVVNGTIRENTTIKYYYRKVLDLVVHHYKKGTTESICDDEHNRLRYNTAYEKDPCTDESKLHEYRYVGVTSSVNTSTINNFTGNVKGNIKTATTITYYYAVPSFTPETSKTGTANIDRRDDPVTYNLHYKGTISNYVGNGKVKLVDKLPYPLKEDDSRINLAGGTYDVLSRTITWIVDWNNIDTTTNGNAVKEINKTITVVYRDIPVTVASINNTFDTTTELTGKTFPTEDEFPTEFNLYKLTVKHLESGTTTEIPNCPVELTENLNYGYEYSTQPCQNIGTEYTLKNIQGDASGTITEDTTIIYYYDVTKYNLKVKHLDIDTNESLVADRDERRDHGYQYNEGTITKDRYQFVELYVSDENANKTDDHVTGALTKDTEITFYYKKYQKIHIIHVDIDRPSIILNEETKDVPYRSQYDEHKKEFNKYKFVDVSSDDTETIIYEDNAKGIIEKDINITYRYKKQLDLVTHHYKKGTTEEICATENEVLPYNTAYDKNKCNNEELLGQYIYAYVESNNNESTINDPEGKVTGNITGDTVINFYYELTTIDINPRKEGPTLLHSRSKAFDYRITDTVKIKDYRGDATITIVDELEYAIDTQHSVLNGGVYDANNKTITWTIAWDNINTNGKTNDTVTKDVSIAYKLYYVDVPMEVEVLTNRIVETVHTAKVDGTEDTYVDTELDPFKLVVHHYKEGTTQELCPTTTELLDEGTSYTKTKCNLDEYDYIEVKKNGTRLDGNTGSVTENISGNTTLDFIYRKKDSTLETTITKDGPDEITGIYQTVTYNIHYEGHVIDYRGDGVITLTDTLPYMIDTIRSSLDGGVYDGEHKIVWTVNWNDIDTYNGKNDTITIDKQIKVVYLDVNIDRTVMTNEVDAKTVLTDKTDLVLATKDTDINLPGKIIVHHYIHGTYDRLFDDDEATGLVHEKYHAQPHEKEGWRIVLRPDDEDIEFTIGEQVLEYTYEKLKYDIKTEILGGVGEITGDEEIEYNEDSTPDYIVITAGEGYEIEYVIVDGTLIDITDKEHMIIDNFKNVKENHLVQVFFSEKPIEVPITGRKTKLVVAAIELIIVNIFIAIKTGYISKVFKKSL